MSFGFGVATVVVSIASSLIAWLIARTVEERSSCISLGLLRLALRFQPESERDEFLDEALGNLSQLEHAPLRAITHALGLVPSSLSIAHSWRAEKKLALASTRSEEAKGSHSLRRAVENLGRSEVAAPVGSASAAVAFAFASVASASAAVAFAFAFAAFAAAAVAFAFAFAAFAVAAAKHRRR